MNAVMTGLGNACQRFANASSIPEKEDHNEILNAPD